MATETQTIAGYRLRSLLQTGQHSQVYEVVEPSSNRHFAMKVLLPEAAGQEDKRRMLFHEAEIGTKLRHENVINILKVNRDKHTPHFIMEFFPSGSPGTWFREPDGEKKQDRLKFLRENAKRIFVKTATGLAYMHSQGFIHRDVKPDNLLVNQLGQTKLIDFAISQRVKTGFAKWFHRKGRASGTPSYMSPEQIRDELIDGRADMYSYACMLYELTTHRKPFSGATQADLLIKHCRTQPDSPQSHAKELTDDFADLVLRMLKKKREDRPKDFYEVLMALRKMKVYKDETYTEEEGMG